MVHDTRWCSQQGCLAGPSAEHALGPSAEHALGRLLSNIMMEPRRRAVTPLFYFLPTPRSLVGSLPRRDSPHSSHVSTYLFPWSPAPTETVLLPQRESGHGSPPNRERGSEGRKSEWRTGPDECQGNVRWRHPAEGHIAYVWPCPFPASCGHAQRRGSLGPRARSAASTLSCTRPSSGAWLAAAPSLSLSPLLSAPGLHPPCLPPSLLPLRAPWRSLGDPAGRSSSVEAAATRRRRLVSVGTRRRPSS